MLNFISLLVLLPGRISPAATEFPGCLGSRAPCIHLPEETWNGKGYIEHGERSQLVFINSQLSMAHDSSIRLHQGGFFVVNSSETSNQTVFMGSKATIWCSYANVFNDADRNYCDISITDRRLWMDNSSFMHLGRCRFVAEKEPGETAEGIIYFGKSSFISLSDRALVEITGNFALLNLGVSPRLTIGFEATLRNEGVLVSSGHMDLGRKAAILIDSKDSVLEVGTGCKLGIAEGSTLALHSSEVKGVLRADEKKKDIYEPIYSLDNQIVLANYELVPQGTQYLTITLKHMTTSFCGKLCSNRRRLNWYTKCNIWTHDGQECRLGKSGTLNGRFPEKKNGNTIWSGSYELWEKSMNRENSACVAINDESEYFVTQGAGFLHYNELNRQFKVEEMKKDEILKIKFKHIRGRYYIINGERILDWKGEFDKTENTADIEDTFELREIVHSGIHCRIFAYNGNCLLFDEDRTYFKDACYNRYSLWKLEEVRNFAQTASIESAADFWKDAGKKADPESAAIIQLAQNSKMDTSLPSTAPNVRLEVRDFKILVAEESVFKIDSRNENPMIFEKSLLISDPTLTVRGDSRVVMTNFYHSEAVEDNFGEYKLVPSTSFSGRAVVQDHSVWELITNPHKTIDNFVEHSEILINDWAVLALSADTVFISHSRIRLDGHSVFICRGAKIFLSFVTLDIRNRGAVRCSEFNIGRYDFREGNLEIPYNTEILLTASRKGTNENDEMKKFTFKTSNFINQSSYATDVYFDLMKFDIKGRIVRDIFNRVEFAFYGGVHSDGLIKIINQHWSYSLCFFEFFGRLVLRGNSTFLIDLSQFKHQHVIIRNNITIEKNASLSLHEVIDQ